MKKCLLSFIITLVVAGVVFAADTVTYDAFRQPTGTGLKVTLLWQADSFGDKADYNIPDSLIALLKQGYYLYSIITKPGSTAPVDNYDIFIYDTLARDILGGGGSNRSSTLIQEAFPATVPQMITGPLTVRWQDVETLDADGTLVLNFARY